MKPAPFDYVRPSSVAEAIAALREADGEARLIAGGQSLGPMLNLRLTQPRLLVDIAGLGELTETSETGDAVRIGACTTAANIEDGRLPPGAPSLLPRVARGISYRAVRNRGTIAGSLCHADPAADWVAVLPALGAVCEIRGNGGTREVPAAEFMASAFETVLAPGELLAAIRVPKLSAAARCGVEKIARKSGKFAMALGVCVADPERNTCRAVIGATHGRPIMIENADELVGTRRSDGTLAIDEAFVGRLFDKAGIEEPASRQIHMVALKRAAGEALAR